jgi:predicted ATPase
LGPRSWRDEYRLSLELHNAAAEMACCTAQFEQVDVHLSAITQNARNFDDTLRAQTTSVNALGSSGRLYEAIDRGMDILKALNVHLPRRASLFQSGVAYLLLRRKLKGKTNERIIRLPSMDDPQKIAAMQMLNIMVLYTVLVDPESAPFVAIKMVEMTLAYGLSTVSCVGFSVFAMLVCGYVCSVQLNAQTSTHSSLFINMASFGGDIDEGFRLGTLSIELYEKFKANVWLCRVSVFFYGFVYGWKRPILETVPKLRFAYQRGLESGDIEFAMINASLACWLQMENTPISIVDCEIASIFDRLEFHGQKVAMMLIKPFWQSLRNLAGYSSADVTALNGEIITEKEIEDIRSLMSSVHEFALFHKLILSYTFGDYIKAEQCAKGCQSLIDNPFGATDLVMVFFFDALTAIEMSRLSTRFRRFAFLARAKKRLARIKTWAKYSPKNFLGKQKLVEAELAAANKAMHSSCLAKYACAIALSRESGFLMQSALACERAGKYCLGLGDNEDAATFFAESLVLYKQWGANAKVTHLMNEIERLSSDVAQRLI